MKAVGTDVTSEDSLSAVPSHEPDALSSSSLISITGPAHSKLTNFMQYSTVYHTWLLTKSCITIFNYSFIPYQDYCT